MSVSLAMNAAKVEKPIAYSTRLTAGSLSEVLSGLIGCIDDPAGFVN